VDHSPLLDELQRQTGDMVQARLKAMTEANIRAGWRSTGLYPFQPSRVIPDVPVPSTPPRQGSRLSQTPLASITRENHEFLTQYGDIIRTPVKNRLQELSSASEAVHARNTILEKENRDFKDAQTGGKRKKAGVTVSNLETHVFSTEDVLAKVRAAEDARRPRGQRVPGENLVRDALMTLQPNPFMTSPWIHAYWAEYMDFQRLKRRWRQ